MKTVVSVTWDDIMRDGHEGHCCPLSRAIARAVRQEVQVGIYSFAVMEGFKSKRYYLPQRAILFLEHYDNENENWISRIKRWFYVRPFTFFFESK